MSADLRARSPRAVFDDHLALARQGRVEDDLQRNYAPDCVVLMGQGVYHGHDGVRVLADQLSRELPRARFDYTTRLVERDVALLEWSAQAEGGASVDDGVDSFVIREGWIVAQTIHYTVR